MARLQVNLSDVETEYDPIPSGQYVARLVGAKEETSSSGNPMIVWQWKIMRGDHKGREIRSYTSMQPQALFSLKEHLEAFGVDADGEIDIDTNELVGRMATIDVLKTTATVRGEEREVDRVEAVRPAPADLQSQQAAASDADKAEGAGGSDDIPF